MERREGVWPVFHFFDKINMYLKKNYKLLFYSDKLYDVFWDFLFIILLSYYRFIYINMLFGTSIFINVIYILYVNTLLNARKIAYAFLGKENNIC